MRKLFIIALVCALVAGCSAPASSSMASSTIAAPTENGGSSAEAVSLPPSDGSSDGSEAGSKPMTPVASSASTQKPADASIALGAVAMAAYTERECADTENLSALPATQSWPKAYESFYCGDDRVDVAKLVADIRSTEEPLALRGNFVFPIFHVADGCIDSLAAYADAVVTNGAAAGVVQKLMLSSNRIGFLIDTAKTKTYFGEGFLNVDPDMPHLAQSLHYDHFEQGVYTNRLSMTMTAGVERQLLAMGFSPATTTACALILDGYTNGVCFIDGNKAAFLNNRENDVNMGQLHAGIVYSFDLLAKDILARKATIGAAMLPATDPPATDSGRSPDVAVPHEGNPDTGKPVIYLYPERPTDVAVKLGYPARSLATTIPAYDGGWQVTAYPDGRLVNACDGKEYPYLFWEGYEKIDWAFSEGFSVRGSDVGAFLRENLPKMGLIPTEYEEFIDYWEPEMRLNDWNLITFSHEQYETLAPLEITPAPDHVLRVHMVFKAIDAPIALPAQTFTSFVRDGFTVVEWGGTRA